MTRSNKPTTASRMMVPYADSRPSSDASTNSSSSTGATSSSNSSSTSSSSNSSNSTSGNSAGSGRGVAGKWDKLKATFGRGKSKPASPAKPKSAPRPNQCGLFSWLCRGPEEPLELWKAGKFVHGPISDEEAAVQRRMSTNLVGEVESDIATRTFCSEEAEFAYRYAQKIKVMEETLTLCDLDAQYTRAHLDHDEKVTAAEVARRAKLLKKGGVWPAEYEYQPWQSRAENWRSCAEEQVSAEDNAATAVKLQALVAKSVSENRSPGTFEREEAEAIRLGGRLVQKRGRWLEYASMRWGNESVEERLRLLGRPGRRLMLHMLHIDDIPLTMAYFRKTEWWKVDAARVCLEDGSAC